MWPSSHLSFSGASAGFEPAASGRDPALPLSYGAARHARQGTGSCPFPGWAGPSFPDNKYYTRNGPAVTPGAPSRAISAQTAPTPQTGPGRRGMPPGACRPTGWASSRDGGGGDGQRPRDARRCARLPAPRGATGRLGGDAGRGAAPWGASEAGRHAAAQGAGHGTAPGCARAAKIHGLAAHGPAIPAHFHAAGVCVKGFSKKTRTPMPVLAPLDPLPLPAARPAPLAA